MDHNFWFRLLRDSYCKFSLFWPPEFLQRRNKISHVLPQPLLSLSICIDIFIEDLYRVCATDIFSRADVFRRIPATYSHALWQFLWFSLTLSDTRSHIRRPGVTARCTSCQSLPCFIEFPFLQFYNFVGLPELFHVDIHLLPGISAVYLVICSYLL